jgi:hypothetical protein
MVVQRHTVLASPADPRRNGGMLVPEHTHRCSDIEPFRKCRENFSDPVGGGLKPEPVACHGGR